jgi:hypothetical protein
VRSRLNIQLYIDIYTALNLRYKAIKLQNNNQQDLLRANLVAALGATKPNYNIMKIKLKQLSLLCGIFLLAFLSSCIDDVATPSTASSNGTFTATLDGVAFNSKTAFAVLVKDTAQMTQWMAIGGQFDRTEISIVLFEPIKTEAYSTGVHSAFFFRVSSADEKIYTPTSGNVTITKSDAASKTVSGTFELTGEEEDSGEIINVKNGVFTNVKYELGFE